MFVNRVLFEELDKKLSKYFTLFGADNLGRYIFCCKLGEDTVQIYYDGDYGFVINYNGLRLEVKCEDN